MTIAELITSLQALPDHTRKIVVKIWATDGLGESSAGSWDEEVEPLVHDLESQVVIDAYCPYGNLR